MAAVRVRGAVRGFFQRLRERPKRVAYGPSKGTSLDIPAGLDWEVWRIVASPRMGATLKEIREDWSLLDLLDAHITLDLLDDAEARARAPKPR